MLAVYSLNEVSPFPANRPLLKQRSEIAQSELKIGIFSSRALSEFKFKT